MIDKHFIQVEKSALPDLYESLLYKPRTIRLQLRNTREPDPVKTGVGNWIGYKA